MNVDFQTTVKEKVRNQMDQVNKDYLKCYIKLNNKSGTRVLSVHLLEIRVQLIFSAIRKITATESKCFIKSAVIIQHLLKERFVPS